MDSDQEDSNLVEWMDDFDQDKKVGPPISKQLEKTLTKIITKDTNDENIDKLFAKPLHLENVKGMNRPKCNPEDIKLQKAQKRINGGLCKLSYAIDSLVELKSKKSVQLAIDFFCLILRRKC